METPTSLPPSTMDERRVPSYCALCAIQLFDEVEELHPHHSGSAPNHWGYENAVWCNFFHRGFIQPRPTDEDPWQFENGSMVGFVNASHEASYE